MTRQSADTEGRGPMTDTDQDANTLQLIPLARVSVAAGAVFKISGGPFGTTVDATAPGAPTPSPQPLKPQTIATPGSTPSRPSARDGMRMAGSTTKCSKSADPALLNDENRQVTSSFRAWPKRAMSAAILQCLCGVVGSCERIARGAVPWISSCPECEPAQVDFVRWNRLRLSAVGRTDMAGADCWWRRRDLPRERRERLAARRGARMTPNLNRFGDYQNEIYLMGFTADPHTASRSWSCSHRPEGARNPLQYRGLVVSV
jgi:hypothetical protein